jgi:hypothetical protein
MIEGLLAIICAGGIYLTVPQSTWYKKYRVKKDWYKIMDMTKTKNEANETFEVKSIDLYKNDSLDILVKVPVGLTPESLEKLYKTLEYNFGGDIAINWDKYKGFVSVKINKDPKVKEESIKKRWSKALSSKEVKNRFRQYFEVTEVTINNNSNYILTIMTPISLSKESLQDFRTVIMQNLKDETMESFHNESNDIFITISNKPEKDSL